MGDGTTGGGTTVPWPAPYPWKDDSVSPIEIKSEPYFIANVPVPADGLDAKYEIPPGTRFPSGTTRIVAFSASGKCEMQEALESPL